MITKTMHERCGDLFAAYPLADDDGEMVLMTSDRKTAKFFILGRKGDGGYWLDTWQGDGVFDIGAETGDIPAWVADAITGGVPLPRDGSLFGWRRGGDITALVATYSQYTPETLVPSFSTELLPGTSEKEWPPFAGAPLFGPWFWEHYRDGRIVNLAGLISGTQRMIFWVDTVSVLGSGCTAVAQDVKGPAGTLRQGVYVWHGTLRAGKAVPSLADLLADSGKTDLGPRFRRMAEASR
jgi:hypothetical protein